MAGGGEVELRALTVKKHETTYEKRLRGRLLNIARKLGMPAIDCQIWKQRFPADECGGPSSIMTATVFTDKSSTVEGYGGTRIAAMADALRVLADYYHPTDGRFEGGLSDDEVMWPAVDALMPLFRPHGSVDLVALCTSPAPYVRELGMRLSAIARTVVPPHPSSQPPAMGAEQVS
jgi:hypothetical protein